MDKNKTIIRSTTVVCVRDNESVVIASDGQVTWEHLSLSQMPIKLEHFIMTKL